MSERSFPLPSGLAPPSRRVRTDDDDIDDIIHGNYDNLPNTSQLSRNNGAGDNVTPDINTFSDSASLGGSMTNAAQGDPVFRASIDDAKTISHLLQAVMLDNKNSDATICLNERGLQVRVEKYQIMQATAYIAKERFRWHLTRNMEFRIELKYLLNCLGIFTEPISDGMYFNPLYTQAAAYPPMEAPSVAMSLKLTMLAEGYPLELELTEADVITKCTIATKDARLPLSFGLEDDDVAAIFTMESDLLIDLWTDLDFSSETLTITVRKGESEDEANSFELKTTSDIGEITTCIHESSKKVVKLECSSQEPIAFNYSLNLFKLSLRALMPSKRSLMRISKTGTVCVHYVINVGDSTPAFVEFFLCPQVEGED